MKSSILFVLFIFSLSLFACSDSNENKICFSFDERQCGVDPFTNAGNISDKEDAIKLYLKEQGISDPDVEIEEDFYDAVCEACTVCPESYRIFIEVNEEEASTVESLDLFNMQRDDCNDDN